MSDKIEFEIKLHESVRESLYRFFSQPGIVAKEYTIKLYPLTRISCIEQHFGDGYFIVDYSSDDNRTFVGFRIKATSTKVTALSIIFQTNEQSTYQITPGWMEYTITEIGKILAAFIAGR